MKNYTELMNYLIDKYHYNSYLEIGTFNGQNFENMHAPDKECCDVDDYNYDNITYHMPSDEMFAQMPVNKKYDIIFIDGMHDEEYVDRDIINSLQHLNPGGVVCIHDVIIKNASSQVSYENFVFGSEWNGTVWKSITKLQENNLEFYTVWNDSYGLTIIKYKDNPHALKFPEHNTKIRYEYVYNNTGDFCNCLTEQGKYVLHVISEEDFFNIF